MDDAYNNINGYNPTKTEEKIRFTLTNSLLVLKMRLQFFSFARKRYKSLGKLSLCP